MNEIPIKNSHKIIFEDIKLDRRYKIVLMKRAITIEILHFFQGYTSFIETLSILEICVSCNNTKMSTDNKVAKTAPMGPIKETKTISKIRFIIIDIAALYIYNLLLPAAIKNDPYKKMRKNNLI